MVQHETPKNFLPEHASLALLATLISSAVKGIFIIIQCIFSFLLIGRELIAWPKNNCLQIRVLLKIMFCSCVIETTLLCENGESVPRAGREWFDMFKSSKLWSSQLWTQFKQLRIEAWKSQDFNGVWTRDLAIPVRRSHQLSYEAADVGSWSFVSSNEPVKNGCEVIYEMFHILNCRFEIK